MAYFLGALQSMLYNREVCKLCENIDKKELDFSNPLMMCVGPGRLLRDLEKKKSKKQITS
jgi:hypothetical protein